MSLGEPISTKVGQPHTVTLTGYKLKDSLFGDKAKRVYHHYRWLDTGCPVRSAVTTADRQATIARSVLSNVVDARYYWIVGNVTKIQNVAVEAKQKLAVETNKLTSDQKLVAEIELRRDPRQEKVASEEKKHNEYVNRAMSCALRLSDVVVRDDVVLPGLAALQLPAYSGVTDPTPQYEKLETALTQYIASYERSTGTKWLKTARIVRMSALAWAGYMIFRLAIKRR